MSTRASRSSFLLLPAFLLSGYAALAYEMSWMRRLVSLFGVTYFAITTILTVFMAGLALGNFSAGKLVDRWQKRPLLVFAGLELFLAVYAQLFPHVRHIVEGVYLSWSLGSDASFTAHAALRFLCAVLILLPPTLVSGATLPAASKAFVTRDTRIGADLAVLYGANVVGAASGALLTTFFTIGLFGYGVTAWLGTSANLVAAGLALIADRRRHAGKVAPPAPRVAPPSSPREETGPPRDETAAERSGRGWRSVWRPEFHVVGTAYFVVGFCALGTEVLWTRAFSQFGFNPATYVFGLILATWLTGHAIGSSLLYPLLVRWVSPRRLFPALPIAIGLMSAASVPFLRHRPDIMTPVHWLRSLGMVLPAERAWLLIPALLLPAACSGAMFPLASKLSIRGVGGVGRGVGSLAALSTVGGIAGSFLTGFFLLPALGAVHGIILFAGLVLMAGVWSAWALAPRGLARLARAAAGTVVAAAITVVVIAEVPAWAHLILFENEKLITFAEGRNSSTAVIEHPARGRMMLVQGERLMGGGSDIALAAQLHPSPRSALIIGLGTGRVTIRALQMPVFQEVTAVDVDGDLPAIIPYMNVFDDSLMEPPRFRFVEDDGRHYLLTHRDSFDIIVNDAAIYAWYLELSTLEFNRLARSRLAPEGLYVGRLHTRRITRRALRNELRTFLEVFPNAAFWKLTPDIGMLVGRNGDRPVDDYGDVYHGGLDAQYEPQLWMTADQMRAEAEQGRLITDARPLHIPYTFLPYDLQPILEYTPPGALPGAMVAPQAE